MVAEWLVDDIDARAADARAASVPLLLSLPQSNGEEIRQLVRRGLVRTTESETAVRDEDVDLIVAVPLTMPHRSHLRDILAGYRITSDTDFSVLLGKAEGDPQSQSYRQCRSVFINFDKADLAGTTSHTFANIGRVCNLHTPHSTQWGLALWADQGVLNDFAGDSDLARADSVLTDSPKATELRTAIISQTKLPPGDSKLLACFRDALVALALRLCDDNWTLRVSKFGLLNRDTSDPAACFAILSLAIAEKKVSDTDCAVSFLSHLTSKTPVEVLKDGKAVTLGG